MAEDPFTLALGVTTPWKIAGTELRPSDKRPGQLEMHINIDFVPGSKFECPCCGELCAVHDTRERVWRHMNFFQYRCYIHARVPRVECGEHGVKTVRVPWGREGSGFTLMMEGVLLSLMQHMPVNTVAREVGEHDTKLWRMLDYYIEDRKKGRNFSDVECIGVDEYSHKGHDYITVFMSPATDSNGKARVLDMEKGKGNDTVNAFQEKFSTLDGKKENVKDVTSDMCHGYRNSMQKAFPNALLTVDKFHVIKNSSDMVDNVRKREMKSRDKRKAMALSRSRYVFLKNPENLTEEQTARLKELQQLEYLDTVVAYDYHMRLKAMYELCGDYDEAACYLEALSLEMSNSRMPEVQKEARSLARNAVEILNYFVSRKTNAMLEGFNSKISIIKNRARGFRTMRNFMNMIYFCMGGFDFPLVHLA